MTHSLFWRPILENNYGHRASMQQLESAAAEDHEVFLVQKNTR